MKVDLYAFLHGIPGVSTIFSAVHSVSLLITFMILSWGSRARAEFAVDLDNLEQVEDAILDHPRLLNLWLAETAAANRPLGPVQALRLTRLKLTQWDDAHPGMPSSKAIDDAIAIAEKLGLYSDYTDLLFLKIARDQAANFFPTDEAKEEAYRQMVARASLLPGTLWRARALVHLSSFLHERGRAAEALSTIQEAYQISKDLKGVPDIMILPVLLHLSTMLNATGQQDRAFVIFQDIQAICDRRHLRVASQRNLYSIGKHFGFEGPARDLDQAAAYTERSLVITKELGAPWELAIVHTSLINIERRRNQLHKALEHARIALDLFEKTKDSIWTAEVHIQWAEVLIARKDFSGALRHLDQASALFPANFKRDHAQILRLKSEGHRGLGQHERALTLFEQFHHLDRELAREREQDSYTRSKVTLGLQFEEEKNKVLAAEKALVDQKLKTAQLYTALGLMAFAFVIGLGFLAVRLHRENTKIIELQNYIHRGVLLRFLPPVIVEEIISGRSRLESEPKEELVTVIFADIVNFTRITEELGVTHTAHILNRFLHVMTEVIFAEGGTIDKFIGDAVMVLFGAPTHLKPEEQAQKAVRCAMSMLKAVDKLSEELFIEFGHRLAIRVGINQGRAIVGTFGGLRRSDYTAIGPAVNLASRIEAKAHPQEILVSESVAALLAPDRLHNRGLHTVKGYDQEVQLFAWSPEGLSKAV
ncbi:MAG TPA: adenylate/guanylate cyclase domain-containing protein [Oligoflexus sp.]|uniref:adenylate/guanylate cyclase domain-containing protein n=1 Tax=Oligoflexus sp. TaxID=1971216 RepID=UPI002D5732FB|nr:adenylate/guanylate cyclase domain-containing protein [Oligoflexus sp.]HYX36043.1 adenylate/guanylate cyclase domain-containing protein [Oligoflexus sp.]